MKPQVPVVPVGETRWNQTVFLDPHSFISAQSANIILYISAEDWVGASQ